MLGLFFTISIKNPNGFLFDLYLVSFVLIGACFNSHFNQIMSFTTLHFDNPKFGMHKKTSNEETNSVIMTEILDFIMDHIGLPPTPANLTWIEEDGHYVPVIRYPSKQISLGSDKWKAIMKYRKASEKLDTDALHAEIHYALEEYYQEKTTTLEPLKAN